MLVGDIDVTRSIQRGLNDVFAFVPEFLAALAILVIGWFIAKAVGRLVWRLLHRAGLDRIVHHGPGGSFVSRVLYSPSQFVGSIAKWALFLGAVSLAVSVLGINALTNFVGAIFAYLPNVLAAVLIFLVAGAVSAAVAALAQRTLGGTGLGKILATAAPVLIMAIAGFMILEQLEIAPEIVRITYAAIMGALALGFALAFGLGGRSVADRMLSGAYERTQERIPELKQDAREAKEQAASEAEALRAKAEARSAGNAPGARTYPPEASGA